MLSCQEILRFAELQEFSKDWDLLASRSEFVDIYRTFGFASAWWKAYGENKNLQTFLIHDEEGRLRLIAPFYYEAEEPEIWKLIPSHRADYQNLIFSSGDIESVRFLFSCLNRRKGWQTLVLTHLPENSEILNCLPNGYGPDSSVATKLRSWLAVDSPLVYRHWSLSHPLIRGKKFSEMLNLIQSKNYRKHVNWFKRQGELNYCTITDPEQIKSFLPKFMELHINEWKPKGNSSIFLQESDRKFYYLVTTELASYNALRMDILKLNGDLIAAHFGFKWSGRFYYYKPCHNPDYFKHSPGKILLACMIGHAVKDGIEEFDLLYGLEPYKEKYMSCIRKTVSLNIDRSRLKVILKRLGIS